VGRRAIAWTSFHGYENRVMAAAVSVPHAPVRREPVPREPIPHAPVPQRPADTAPLPSLGERERRIVLALAAAVIPAGTVFEAGGAGTLRRYEQWLAGANAFQMGVAKALLWTAELASLPRTGRVFSALSPARAARFLEGWAGSRIQARRVLLRAIITPIKVAHFDDRRAFEAVGCKSFHQPVLAVSEPVRWMQQVVDGRAIEEDLELECEVVVVGTGAGGAACAYELASRGRAVLLLEEGDFHRRGALTGRTQPMVKKLYRDQGLTLALGNVGIPVFAGRAVGGSTVINSGTCYRAPERVFHRWRDDDGLTWFTRAAMDPYYARVEAMLGVERARFELTGGVGRVVARGAEKMGLRHRPVDRNAPDCDGQGVCCFGCPTGAKRSTDVSYVPAALERGAQLVTAARVDGIEVVAGRARGVTARLASGKRLRVKAEAVVVAGGALMTPLVLREAGVGASSPALGKNLSIHPATKTLALFDEVIDMAQGIPQGYSIDELEDEGIMFEGGSVPLEILAASVPWVGKRFVDLVARYQNLALFGLMIEDTSRGEVRPGPRGSPLITYSMNGEDTARMQRAVALMCEVFLAAGARRVYPMVPGMEELSTLDEVRRLRTMKLAPSAFDVTAYHPLGTCRMGTNPATSVLGPDFETHEVERLFVADGSAVPTALGVNPQLTIMAMALRAAEIVDGRLG
jgi:choline dehydrogenase-like flavoprotein